MTQDLGASAEADQALVSDQSAARLAPPGFDPSRGKEIRCAYCSGAGLITSWSFGVKEPDECPDCHGSGRNWQYPGGLIAKYYGGPFNGRDSDRSREASETGTGPTEGKSAGPQDIAQPSIDGSSS